MVLAYMMRLKQLLITVLTVVLINAGILGFSRAEDNQSEQLLYSATENRNNGLYIRYGEQKMMALTDEVILFDFVSSDAVSAWRVVNDTVMGGISSSRMVQTADGKAAFIGEVSLENNGGFASAQGPEIKQSLGDFDGLALRVKGDGKNYKCSLRTDDLFDGVSHQAVFATKTGEWQIVKIPFTDFMPTYHGRRLSEDKRLKREFIRKLGFLISDKQNGVFRLEIDWIKAYR
jgi:monofunctional biosynthetic peptidoglycan transglycosylase